MVAEMALEKPKLLVEPAGDTSPVAALPAPAPVAPAPAGAVGPWGQVNIKYAPDMLAYEDVTFPIEDTSSSPPALPTAAVQTDISNRLRNYVTTGGYYVRAGAQFNGSVTMPIANLYNFDTSGSVTDTVYLNGFNGGTAIASGQSAVIGQINIANSSQTLITISNIAVQNNNVVFTILTNTAAGSANSIMYNSIGWTIGGTAYYGNSFARSKEDMLREKIRQQLNPPIYFERDGQKILLKDKDLWDVQQTPEENRARGLLREMVGEEAMRRYLKRGFLMVKGNSGVLYKIYGGNPSARNRGLIESYIKNPATGTFTPFEAFCIQFKDTGLPHTDAVIMRKLLVENDEFGMRKMANVRAINPNNQSAIFNKSGDIVIAGTPYVIPQRVAV